MTRCCGPSAPGSSSASTFSWISAAIRDLHRHRRCIQIGQEFTTKHGYDAPEELEAAGARENYDSVMQRTASAVERLAARAGSEARGKFAVRHSPRLPQADSVQNGFCRGGLHLRTKTNSES